MWRSFLILSVSFLLIQCTTEKKSTVKSADLGQLVFEVSGSEDAQPFFHEGLLLLHSFEFEDAAEKFVKAQELDSSFVMAYWGEAMSYNHPLWRERFYDEGLAALEKLAPSKVERLQLAQTEIEKEFLEGVEILYGEGDKKELDVEYKNHMAKLHEKYPENHEVAAFYALSLLGAANNGRDTEQYEKSATIAQSIINENANHPGALHYLIHSYDDPDHASLAIHAANSYSKVAPDAEHALHMPSHIYVAMGMWDEVISSNIASYGASVKRMKAKGLDNDARGYHAFKWLMYGYLQQANYEKAKQMVYDMKSYCDEKPSSKARSHFIMMQGAYLTESGDWKDSIAYDTVELDKMNLLIKGVQNFTQGMRAYKNLEEDELKKRIAILSEMRTNAELKMEVGSPKMCSGVSRYLQPPSVNEVNSIKVMELQLYALLSMYHDDDENTDKWLKEATEIEKTLTFNYGPPNIVVPSFEMYGKWLLSKNRKSEAQLQLEYALKRAPGRLITTNAMDLLELS